MNTIDQVYATLRHKNIRSYALLAGCSFISVLLITTFSVIMQSQTVQTMLPEGGDSRKQMTMIFTMAIVSCAVFTCYASTLFFRSKSRETGIYMALGTKKSVLQKLLLRDLVLVSLVSAVAGMLLGFPVAVGMWQLLRLLVVDTHEMVFHPSALGFLWPLMFSAFSMIMLFFMGWRFIRRSNIMDIVNEQRKNEPIRDVKRWYGALGLLLMVLSSAGAILLPTLFANFGYTPPVWISLLYVFAVAGLYMLLVFMVVHGVGGKKSYYKNIITRSMMKFQGRQTVLNMCVIALLVISAYFAMFYSPMKIVPALISYANRPVDNAFHYRADETGIPTKDEIVQMATEEGVVLRDYMEASFINLATDGYNREWTPDGRYSNTYHGFYEEEPFLSASVLKAISGMDVQVPNGQYAYITRSGHVSSPYDYYDEMSRFTNPDTMQTLSVTCYGVLEYDMLHGYVVLGDEDYAAIATGLGLQWQEKWVQFNVNNLDGSYAFSSRLKNAIVDGCTEKSAIYENYDRIERMNVQSQGQEYRGDTEPDLQVRYTDRDSSQFNQYWRYIPLFRIVEQKNFMLKEAVFLILFVFMAIICMAAVIVIAYIRCLTIATANCQVYDDLHHLGANRDYLYRSVKGQVSKVFFVPIFIGTIGIFGFYTLLMYLNDGKLDTVELFALGIDAVLVAVTSMVLWGIYRTTLKKVSRMLGVEAVPSIRVE